MKTNRKYFCFVFFLIFSLLIVAQTPDTTTKLTLTILHTNDQHGHLVPYDMKDQQNIGGMAARMTLIQEIRKEVSEKKGRLLLLDSGDVNTGTAVSNHFAAEPDIRIMNLMGYEAMAVGNHEFDLPFASLLSQKAKAEFPYLSVNVFYRDTQKPVFQPTLLLRYPGLTVGILGITPPDTPFISTNGHTPEIYFEQPEKVLPDVLKELSSQADFIIALCHLDHASSLKLAERFPQIHLVLGGHTHLPLEIPKKVGKTWVAEAGCYGAMVGRIDLVFENRACVDRKYEMIGINLTQPILDGEKQIGCRPFRRTFADAPEVVQLLAPYLEKMEKILKKPIGKLLTNIERSNDTVQTASSPLGNLVCDAIREELHLDVALQNAGGIRSDFFAGEVMPQHILDALPFANTLLVYTITGKELEEIFRDMVGGKVGRKGFLEVSGVTVTIENGIPTSILVGGKPLDEKALYRVGINSFVAKGGDGYSVFQKFSQYVDTGFLLSNLLESYIQKHSPLSASLEKRVLWREK